MSHLFIDLRELSLRGGERCERVFPVDLGPVTLAGELHEVLVPDGVTVTIDRVAGGFLIKIALTARVYGSCARCLGEVALDVRAEQQEFVPTTQDEWREADLSAFVNNMVLDVDGLAREAVVLALPTQFLCSEGCKGLCPTCGQDLNQAFCECAPSENEAKWQKLKELKFEDSESS